MGKIDDVFKEKTKELTFIELKEVTNLNINGYKLEGGLPLPVITDNLMTELQYGDLSEEIKLAHIIEGIVFLLGTDPDFPHISKYKEIIYAYDSNILKYIFYKGMKSLEEEKIEDAGVYFRAIIELEPNNLNAILNYALVLETLAKSLIENEKPDEGQEFLIKSTNELESILDIDDSFSLAYYKLGYHYRYSNQFLKAKIIWNKFLILDDDEARLQEIREQIDIIDDDVKHEAGLSYFAYNDFGKAMDSFLKLLPKHDNNWNINYMIGLCYKGLENYERAIDYLKIAINLNKEEKDLYNDLGIIYFVQGKIFEAIKIFNKGIEEVEADYKLFFNRGLGYVQLGEYNLALRDINMANELNPYDENIAKQKEEVERFLDTF